MPLPVPEPAVLEELWRRSVLGEFVHHGWLKECRRVATRFEKLAVNFLAMIHVAFIERDLRVLFSNGA